MCNQYHKVSAKNFWTMPLTRDYYMAKEGVKEQKNSPKSKQKKEAEGPDKRPKASQIDTVSSIVQRGSNNSSSSTIEKRRRSLRLRPRGLWKFTKLDKCVIDCCPPPPLLLHSSAVYRRRRPFKAHRKQASRSSSSTTAGRPAGLLDGTAAAVTAWIARVWVGILICWGLFFIIVL